MKRCDDGEKSARCGVMGAWDRSKSGNLEREEREREGKQSRREERA